MLVNLRLGLMGRELYCESEELAFNVTLHACKLSCCWLWYEAL